jgi:pimeloyl-ACP methyl ester carboxylesterase
VAAGAFSAAGVAFALSHEYARRVRRSGVPAEPELSPPEHARARTIALREGGEAHLYEAGEGPPLLLLHGANLSAQVWAYQLRDLYPGHRVIALDLRGHGGSPAGPAPVTISAMTEDVSEVLAALELEGCVLAGHSMGGMVCLRLARRHPELFGSRIGALALLSTSAGIGSAVPSWGRLAGTVGLVAGAGVVTWPGRALVGGEGGYLASRVGFGRRPRPAEVAATVAMLRSVDQQVFASVVSEVLAFEEAAPFAPLGVPVAIAVGTSDHLTPPLYARRLAAGLEGAAVCEYPGAGHMLMYERRAEIDELLSSLSAEAADRARGPRAQRPGSNSTLTAPVDLASARVSTASRQRRKG